MLMIRDLNVVQQMLGTPINGKKGQSMLRKAGIDTSSAQYKAVMKQMPAGGAIAYTNPQAIKNLMQNFDANGDRLDPVTRLAGMDATDVPAAERRQIIDIPEANRQEMFEATKERFTKDYGTSKHPEYRNEIFTNVARALPKESRLKGTHTLAQYERAYAQAFADACRSADPTWKPGQSLPKGALDGITRQSIESTLVKGRNQYGETLSRQAVNVQV